MKTSSSSEESIMTLLTREQCARLLRVSKTTIITWEKNGLGPPSYKFGNGDAHVVRYDKEELIRWLAKFVKNGEFPKDANEIDLLTTDEVSALLRVAPITLRMWRCKGLGPPYLKFGEAKNARVFYLRSSVMEWLKQFTQAGLKVLGVMLNKQEQQQKNTMEEGR
ncbi:MAG: helix-turn-helix domain-containing protein [Candidatus Caldarchaeum sp.]